MNLFHFLKSKAGKFVLGLPQKVILTTGLGAAVVGAMVLTSDRQPASQDEARVRSSVISTYGRNEVNPAESMGETVQIAGAQGITSANDTLASAGYDWAGDDASLAAVGQLGNNMGGGKTPATRAMGGRSEGLGGNNDIVVVDQKPDSNGGDALAAAGAAGGARAAAMAQRGIMATASGGVSGVTYGGASSRSGKDGAGGTVNRSGNSLGLVGGEAYRLSGSMPEGSTLLASTKFQDVDSSFGASRNARAGRGMESGEGRTLEQMRKRSADIAKNKYRAANEAGRAFMASSQNSGGIQVEDGQLSEGGAISDDFEEATINARKNLGQATDDLMEEELERKQDRTRLKRAMVALVFLTIPAMFAISALVRKAPWGTVAAIAIGALMTLAIGLFMADAGKYMKKWGGSGLTTACMIVGPTLLALIGISYIKAVGKLLNKFTGWLNGVFGAPIVGAASGVGVITGAGQQVLSEGKALKEDGGDITNTELK